MIAIIDYNAGNVQSVLYAMKRLGVEATLTSDPDEIRKAEKVIFPGVGEASSTMEYLRSTGLDEVITSLKQPVLGICLGMQLMCSKSEEGNAECLNLFPEAVLKFPTGRTQNGERLKVPHVGWNAIKDLKGPLYKGLEEGAYVYFVHSFAVATGDDTIATTDYIQPFSASLQKDNFYAVQFHPEKSGVVGEQILRNFIEI